MEHLLAAKKMVTKSSANTFFLPNEHGVVTHFGISQDGLVELSPRHNDNRTQNFVWPPAPAAAVLQFPEDDLLDDVTPDTFNPR